MFLGPRRRPAMVGLVAATAVLTAMPLVAAGDRGSTSGCVRVDTRLEELWEHVAGGWAGGDGALSIRIAPSKSLWFFGDSLVRAADGSGYMLRNAEVLQSGEELQMLPAAARTEPLRPKVGGTWFWPRHGVRWGSSIWVFLWQLRADAGNRMGVAYVRSWLARLSPHTLRVTKLVPLPRKMGADWGAWLLPAGNRVYIFGLVPRRPGSNALRVARTTHVDRLRDWRYWDGRRWISEWRRSATIATGTGNQISVVRAGAGFALLTIRGIDRERRLGVSTARSPAGPWTQQPAIELPGGEPVYGAAAHPELASLDGLLVTYSEWDSSGSTLPRPTPPRFVRLSPECLGALP